MWQWVEVIAEGVRGNQSSQRCFLPPGAMACQKNHFRQEEPESIKLCICWILVLVHGEPEEHFWGCSPSLSEPLFGISYQLKESKDWVLLDEKQPQICGYLPVTNRNFKFYSLKHSEMAQIILEISDRSSLIFEFMSQQTKAFLPHGDSFRPLWDSWM